MRRVDDRLTAYALNEVDADTAAAVEATLTDRPERTTEIDELRATARMLLHAATETTMTSACG
jgi:anti-sigma factor RsiW